MWEGPLCPEKVMILLDTGARAQWDTAMYADGSFDVSSPSATFRMPTMQLITHMKRFFLLLALLAIPGSLMARLMEASTYQEMFDKADLVVIAKPLSTSDTKERSKLPGVGDVIPLIGINTEFETRVVLKGDKKVRKFVLHHYKLAEPEVRIVNGPDLVAFDLKSRKSFLLFLIKEADGRYAPASGQVDPRAFSVIKLDSAANDFDEAAR